MPPGLTESCTTFKRRDGTTGISGHLYETKLLSLLYFRAINNDDIAEFQLASNVDDVGAFDDICFKATVDLEQYGKSKTIVVFIQAKHKENKNQALTINLTTYFNSYLKIRDRFDPSNKDLLFAGKFDETECLFVIYTTARVIHLSRSCDNDSKVERSFCSILNKLINTYDTANAKQPYYQKHDVEIAESLCKDAIKYQITSLARNLIAKFILYNSDKKKNKGKRALEQMLKDNIMLRYHVILAQRVLEVSEIHSHPTGRYRIVTFRPDFFDTNDEYLTLFRDTVYEEIVKEREEPTDIENLLSDFIVNPNDAEKLSKLIGTVITYNCSTSTVLLDINKKYQESVNRFKPQLNQTHVFKLTVDNAVKLAGKEILLSKGKDFKLRVPAAFGNKDIICDQDRIDHLKREMTKLLYLENNEDSKMVTIDSIDNSFKDTFLQYNGGISGAIGNVFVLDDDIKLMKITDNRDALEPGARRLYEGLNEEIPNLSEYKFCFKGNKFPKLSLESIDQEEYLVKDFLDKLLIYSDQSYEKDVEIKLKDEIEETFESVNLDPAHIQAKKDAIFLNHHNEIQTWWMLPKKAPYLTKDNQKFKGPIIYIIEDPLMNKISAEYVREIKRYNFTFTENAVRSLNLQDQHSSTVIITENSVMTVAKVMQHLKNKDHVVLDLEDIVNLPTKERNALRRELTHTNEKKVLILVCNNINEKQTFENVAEAVRDKKTIIITNDSSVTLLLQYFATTETKIVHDEEFSLMDMTGGARG